MIREMVKQTPALADPPPVNSESPTPSFKMRTLVLFYVLLFGLNLVRVVVIMPWEAHLNDVIATVIELANKASIWIGLTYIFVTYGEKQRFLTAVTLKKWVLRGILIGICGSLLPVALLAMQVVFKEQVLHAPPSTLFGTLPVLFAGLIEEIPFRGFLFRHFQTRMSLSAATLLNAVLFVGIHIPMWLSDGMGLNDMIHTGFFLFILGVIFCLAVSYSRSLWSSIIIHTVNNVMSLL